MAVALIDGAALRALALNQIVIGIALTLGVEGLTALLHHFQFSRTYPRLPAAAALVIPLLDRTFLSLAPAFFRHNPIVYLAVALVFAMATGCTGARYSASILRPRATSRRRSTPPASTWSATRTSAVLATERWPGSAAPTWPRSGPACSSPS